MTGELIIHKARVQNPEHYFCQRIKQYTKNTKEEDILYEIKDSVIFQSKNRKERKRLMKCFNYRILHFFLYFNNSIYYHLQLNISSVRRNFCSTLISLYIFCSKIVTFLFFSSFVSISRNDHKKMEKTPHLPTKLV